MVIHLPSSESLVPQSFSAARQLRQQPPPSGSHSGRPVNSLSATLGLPATPSSYRPVDSDTVAYRAALDYDDQTDVSVQLVKSPDETSSRDDAVVAETAAYSSGLDSQTDITGDIEVEADMSSTKRSSASPTASVKVAKSTADGVIEKTSAVQMLDVACYKETRRSEWAETLSEDLPAVEASADVIDVLPLDQLPSSVDEPVPVDTEEGSRDADGVDSEWPPLPSDEELEISSAELELPDDDDFDIEESEEVTGPSTASDISAAAESDVLTKVGASEKILAHAAHLTDVDSMHRFKYVRPRYCVQ